MKKIIFFLSTLVAFSLCYGGTALAQPTPTPVPPSICDDAKKAAIAAAVNNLYVSADASANCGGSNGSQQFRETSITVDTAGCCGTLRVDVTGSVEKGREFYDYVYLNWNYLFSSEAASPTPTPTPTPASSPASSPGATPTPTPTPTVCQMVGKTGTVNITLAGAGTTTFTLIYDTVDGLNHIGASAGVSNVQFTSDCPAGQSCCFGPAHCYDPAVDVCCGNETSHNLCNFCAGCAENTGANQAAIWNIVGCDDNKIEGCFGTANTQPGQCGFGCNSGTGQGCLECIDDPAGPLGKKKCSPVADRLKQEHKAAHPGDNECPVTCGCTDTDCKALQGNLGDQGSCIKLSILGNPAPEGCQTTWNIMNGRQSGLCDCIGGIYCETDATFQCGGGQTCLQLHLLPANKQARCFYDCLIPNDSCCIKADGPQKRTICFADVCIWSDLNGDGPNECATDADCSDGDGGSHRECAADRCINVPGIGPDGCMIDADCTDSSHKACILSFGEKICQVVAGEAPDTCQLDSDCTDSYNACVFRAGSGWSCELTPGMGSDDCQTVLDCESRATPTPTPMSTSTPMPTLTPTPTATPTPTPTPTPGAGNNPPSAVNLRAESIDCCFHENRSAIFEWDFTDPDGDFQSAYQIQIDLNQNGIFGDAGDIDEYVPNSSSTAYIADRVLGWNVSYNWRVMVWDEHGLASDWAYGSLASDTSWPWPQFSYRIVDSDGEEKATGNCTSSGCSNVSIVAGDKIEITNETYNCPNGCNYSWDFGDGGNSSATDPFHIYALSGNYTLSLTATDSTDPTRTCNIEMMINAGGGRLPPPEIIEIRPF